MTFSAEKKGTVKRFKCHVFASQYIISTSNAYLLHNKLREIVV